MCQLFQNSYYIWQMLPPWRKKTSHSITFLYIGRKVIIARTNHPWEIHTISNLVVQVASVTQPSVSWQTPPGPPSWRLWGLYMCGWSLLLSHDLGQISFELMTYSPGNSFNYLWEIHTSSHPLLPAKKATSHGIKHCIPCTTCHHISLSSMAF